jgi:hypothetical protein
MPTVRARSRSQAQSRRDVRVSFGSPPASRCSSTLIFIPEIIAFDFRTSRHASFRQEGIANLRSSPFMAFAVGFTSESGEKRVMFTPSNIDHGSKQLPVWRSGVASILIN